MTEARVTPNIKSAFVTGATGFLGMHLCERLAARGVVVTALVRVSSAPERLTKLKTSGNVIRADGTVSGITEAIQTAQPDIVFHLAANYIGTHNPDDVSALVSDNVELTAKLCEATVAAGCPAFVSAGTAWQNAGGAAGSDTPSPNTLYAATKQAADDIIGYYARTRGLNAITLKIYDSYGPGDPRRKFLNILAETAARGETLRASPGDQKLHMVHVDDLIDGFVHAGNLLASGDVTKHASYTLPSPRAVTLRELAEVWKTAAGISAEIEWGAKAHRPGEVLIPWDGTPLPGWTPRIFLEDGLRDLQD